MLSRIKKAAHSGGSGAAGGDGKPFRGNTYVYEILDRDGNRKTGKLSSTTLREAIRKLERTSTAIIKVERVPADEEGAAIRIGERQLIVFFRALSQLVKSGIPLSRSLEVLETQAEDQRLGDIARHLRESIDSGNSFSQALGSFPHIFSKFRRSIIKAGEEGGVFEGTLSYLAAIGEKEHRLRNKVSNALTYPLFVTSIALLAGFLTMKLIYPSLRTMVSDLGLALPFYTRSIMFVIDNLSSLPVIILASIILYLVVQRFRGHVTDTMQGRTWWEHRLLSVPQVGEFMKKSYVTHAVFTLAVLIKAGIKLTHALELAAETCDSILIGDAINDLSASVRKGSSLADSMRSYATLFPAALITMVEVGEISGTLVEMMDNVIRLYETDLDNTLESFTSLIEPLVIIMLGAAAGLFVIVFFLPVYISLQNMA